MSYIKKTLMLSALVAAVLMPSRAYTHQVSMPGGNAVVYAGITAVCAYIFYCWAQQANPVLIATDDDMYRSVLETFRQDSQDPYEDYLDNDLRIQGYRIYVEEDHVKMGKFFVDMKKFVNPIRDYVSRQNLLDQIDALEQELKAELAISRDHINLELRNSFGARAARASYYAELCNEIIRQAALLPITE